MLHPGAGKVATLKVIEIPDRSFDLHSLYDYSNLEKLIYKIDYLYTDETNLNEPIA